MRETIDDMRHGVVDDIVARHIPENAYPEQWDVAGLQEDVRGLLNLDLPVDGMGEGGGHRRRGDPRAHAQGRPTRPTRQRVETNSAEVMTYVEKQVLLQTLDHLWREHLVTLDHLRQVIGWRGYAQRDPLNEYKSEAFELFNGLVGHLREQVTGQLMRIEVVLPAAGAASCRRCSRSISTRSTGENELAMPQGAASAAARRSASRSAAERPRPLPRRDPNDPLDLGPGRPQRALPLRLGQEVQALPRAVLGVSWRVARPLGSAARRKKDERSPDSRRQTGPRQCRHTLPRPEKQSGPRVEAKGPLRPRRS